MSSHKGEKVEVIRDKVWKDYWSFNLIFDSLKPYSNPFYRRVLKALSVSQSIHFIPPNFTHFMSQDACAESFMTFFVFQTAQLEIECLFYRTHMKMNKVKLGGGEVEKVEEPPLCYTLRPSDKSSGAPLSSTRPAIFWVSSSFPPPSHSFIFHYVRYIDR